MKSLALELGIWAGCVSGWLGSCHKISYSGVARPGHHPASSRVLFLCGCRAVPKAKLSFHTGEKKKKKKKLKPKASAHPSLDQLFFTAGNCIVSLFSYSTDADPCLWLNWPLKRCHFLTCTRAKFIQKVDLMLRCVLMCRQACKDPTAQEGSCVLEQEAERTATRGV